MNRRRFLWLLPGMFLAPVLAKAEGEVGIPEGECVTACWDEQMQEVPCPPEEDVCPDYEPPTGRPDAPALNDPSMPLPSGYWSHTTGDYWVTDNGTDWTYVGNDPRGVFVVQLPSTGTGTTS